MVGVEGVPVVSAAWAIPARQPVAPRVAREDRAARRPGLAGLDGESLLSGVGLASEGGDESGQVFSSVNRKARTVSGWATAFGQ